MTQNKIYKILIVFLLISISIFIVSCSSSTTQTNYYAGIDGVKFDFIKANPKTVFEEEQFTLAMFVRNIGAYSIPNSTKGKITVSYDEYYIIADSDSQKPQNISLHAKDRDYPSGDEEYYEFNFNAKDISTLRELPKTTIDFSLCYPYRTEVGLMTCIDTQINSQDTKTTACKSTTYTNSFGQGAPLVITKIIPEMLPQKNYIRPQFKIYIENKGQGYVINKDPTKNSVDEVCGAGTNRPDSADFNKITVKATLSKIELECIPAELKLINSESYVRCYVKESDAGNFSRVARNYVAPLTITLDYGYYEIAHHTIEIERKDDVVTISSDEECGSYNIYDQSRKQCITLCEFCSKNPSDSKCQKNKPIDSFAFTTDFSCSCTKLECDKLKYNGNCILGYCPGINYCCNTQQTTATTQANQAALADCAGDKDGTECTDNHVCISGKCSTTETECSFTKGTSGYSCMINTSCDATTIEKGLCPGSASNVCCKAKTTTTIATSPDSFCAGKLAGAYCKEGYVCNQNLQCSLTYCDYLSQIKETGYENHVCRIPIMAETGCYTVYGFEIPTATKLCPDNLSCCIKTAS